MKHKRCLVCTNFFYPNSNSQKYCGDSCRKFAENMDRQKKKPKKVKSIAEMQREAREHGMSYGQYDTYLRLQKGVK